MSRNGESPGDGETPGDVRVGRNPHGWEYVYKPRYVPDLLKGAPAIPYHGPDCERRVISPQGDVFAPGDDGFVEAIENFRSGFASNGNLASRETPPDHTVPQEGSTSQEMQL